ncbi:MAG: DUF1376 domain-containing protein [Bacteroidales bacterium]|nr:DUF1376 domain-containing protein [Bacteroidales bacterium]
MNKSPAFLLYPRDFLEGTEDMTYEETGMYIRLLCHEWERGYLPADKGRLSRLLRVPLSTLEVPWQILSEKFEEKDGKLFNSRLENERKSRIEYIEGQKLKGTIGAFLKIQKRQLLKKEYDKLKSSVLEIDTKGMDKGTLEATLKSTLKASLSTRVENEDGNICIDNSSIKYSSYYDKQIELAQVENNLQYEEVVKILFGNNSLKQKLSAVLSLRTQLSFEQSKELMFYKAKHKISFGEILVEMEGWKPLTQKHTTVFGSFKTFMKNKYPELKKTS